MQQFGRFSYVAYDKAAQEKQQAFKKAFEELEALADSTLKTSRPKSLFMTSLEEAYMWTGKAIRDEQIERDAANTKEQPGRGNE